jgi:hypothetical protein
MIDIRSDLTPILSDLAIRERRTVSQQAAYLLEQALLTLARTKPVVVVTPGPALEPDAPVALPAPDEKEDA